MRFDTNIDFLRFMPGEYNAETGDYDDDGYRHDRRMAQVYDASSVTLRHEYGAYKQGDLIASIHGHLAYTPDSVVVRGKKYSVEQTRMLRRFQTFHLTETQQEIPPCR